MVKMNIDKDGYLNVSIENKDEKKEEKKEEHYLLFTSLHLGGFTPSRFFTKKS